METKDRQDGGLEARGEERGRETATGSDPATCNKPWMPKSQ